MSVQTVAHQFVELCRQGKNFDVMRHDVRAKHRFRRRRRKANRRATAGDQEIRGLGLDKIFHGETVAGPFFNGQNPDQFIVYFTQDITPNAAGKRVTREEVAVYTVNDTEKITREQFFYEGEH